MLTLKKVIGLLIGIGLLLLSACGDAASAVRRYQEQTQTAQASTSVQCEGTTMTVAGGMVECDGDYAVFGFAEETTTFACTPNGDTLTCDTGKGTVFTITAPELPTPTPEVIPQPTLSEEDWEELENNGNVTHSLTGFYDCGIYSVGVSTLEELGGGDATCSGTTFTITLPVATGELWCARSVYGWSCGSEDQSFWFFLLPTW